MGITTMLRNYKDTGYPLRVQIWTLFTVKLWHLGIADFLMVASTAITLPLHKICRSQGGLTWDRGGMAIQSIYQVGWLSFWVAVPFILNWTWTSQVYLLLHTMVLLMKMHSYAFYNGHLSETEKRLRALDEPHGASKAPAYNYPTVEKPMGEVLHGDMDIDSDSEDEGLSQLREDLARELTSPIGNVTYPKNLSWSNYIDFLLCPTLCYELEYPRNEKINWTSLIAKIVATFGCIFLLTIISEEFILPVLQDSTIRLDNASSVLDTLLILAETISWLLFPFMLIFLLVFLVIFEYVLGAFAEITRFADRHFYSDWWNSTDWMEFSREWNVPVYSFLRRHVYATSRPTIGRNMATIITFLISAIGHEIVMACITKKIRGYGFICQMLQLPIVMLQRTRWIRQHKTANNVLFWISMILGLSLVSHPLFRYYEKREANGYRYVHSTSWFDLPRRRSLGLLGKISIVSDSNTNIKIKRRKPQGRGNKGGIRHIKIPQDYLGHVARAHPCYISSVGLPCTVLYALHCLLSDIPPYTASASLARSTLNKYSRDSAGLIWVS